MTSPEPSITAGNVSAAAEAAGLLPLTRGVAERFVQYYELLAQWNSRLNLTAIRTPEGTLRRHFMECIFCAQHLPNDIATMLDYGSGAGFPGIPIALCRPEVRVTLAESQGKKASFLREAVRTLGLSAEVYTGRVETMPPDRIFDAVALRAVDDMELAVSGALARVRTGGYLVALTTARRLGIPTGLSAEEIPIPQSENGVLLIAHRVS